ncbi:MAG: cytochrome c3 family protein [Pyrinomonadaceae bacterium]
MLRRWWLKTLVVIGFVAIVIGVFVVGSRPVYVGTRAGKADENYIDSSKCLACHEGHYASWRRTYHSRMTQTAETVTVQGDFTTNNTLEYLGVKARMERRPDGFFATFSYPDGRTETNKIERTVGSRRMEQYLIKEAGQYTRLPLAYDLVNRRWISLNGSFFHADSTDYQQHRAQWDSNCVFCHNVKAQPNMDFGTRTFKTEVAELGIACGACHGQTAKHIDEANSWLSRFSWWRDPSASRSVIHPEKLSAERSLMMCGHCHGQRVPEPLDRIRQIMGPGDPYNAGDDLSALYRPVQRDTVLGDFSFANRFWNNGSPRLTAYEYQGILRSACYMRGKPEHKISCLSCHSMHDGDPKGMILPVNRTNTACLECHQKFSDGAALAQHTGHGAASTGSSCYSCHMPRVVYGVMSFHPTHDISIPRPDLTVTRSVPNACNLCHLDRSVNWAIESSRRLWPAQFAAAQPAKDPMFNEAEGPRMLFAGDALTRAMAAEAMSGGGAVNHDPNWTGPFLLEAFNDNYPIVRYFAANGLAAINLNLAKPDYLGIDEARRASVTLWAGIFNEAARRHSTQFAIAMRARRSDVDMDVGE